jgi:2-keto-4-pentenoate hydratase/2-oxohepta-3-ene-1,7-dioic acid hydratase in catechol pathway
VPVRFASYTTESGERAAVALGDSVFDLEAAARAVDVAVPPDLQAFIEDEALTTFRAAIDRLGPPRIAPLPTPRFSAPYRNPPKIWGIGLNYRAHAADLNAPVPDEPASFMKPHSTIIGPGATILLPLESGRVTAEAEVGLVLGRRCRDISEADAASFLFGYVPILDMTAEDIFRRNPHFLTRAKSFDTFLSVGPWILTTDEVPDLATCRIATIRNGTVAAANSVSNMVFSPERLLALTSRVFEFEPGDLLLTGTPGAVPIDDGDEAACRIDGFSELRNPVRRGHPNRRGGER